jgi:low affinity Fe/Cu permease
MNEIFHKIAHKASETVGSAWAFALALALVLFWIMTGPLFDYSNTWQLFINTLTTIATFLLVFLIQNTQNRDAKAIHLKLDELIRALRSAKDSYIDLEDMEDSELEKLQKEFEDIRKKIENHKKTRLQKNKTTKG